MVPAEVWLDAPIWSGAACEVTAAMVFPAQAAAPVHTVDEERILSPRATATDATAARIADRIAHERGPQPIDDSAGTCCRDDVMGIENLEARDRQHRPYTMLAEGRPLTELF